MSAEVHALREAIREIEDDFRAPGLRITVERTISFFNSEIKHALRIERERITASGRQGKPEPIVVLVNNPGESPADMLRTLADLLAQESA
jgi:hypothetical protein